MSGKPRRRGLDQNDPGSSKQGQANQGPAQVETDTPLTAEQILEIENSTVKNNNKTLKDAETALPPRLGYYLKRETKQVTLLANCFGARLAGNAELYQYTIEFQRMNLPSTTDDLAEKTSQLTVADSTPSTTNTAGQTTQTGSTPAPTPKDDPTIPKGTKLGHIMFYFLNSTEEFRVGMENGTMATDFRSILITTTPLPEATVQIPRTITYKGQKSKYKEDEYLVTIQGPRPISPEYTRNYLQGTKQQKKWAEVKKSGEMIQALNIMYRNSAKWNSMKNIVNAVAPDTAVIGSKTYFLNNPPSLGGGLVAVPGFFSSIRPAAGRLLMNVNLTHGAFYKAGSLKELMKDFGVKNGDSGSHKKFHAFIRGLAVRLNHRESVDSDKKEIPTVKTIYGLATRQDGRHSGDQSKSLKNPPKMDMDWAKCNQVQFFLRDKKGGKDEKDKKGKMVQKDKNDQEETGKYVFVDKYFRQTYQDKTFNPNDYAVNVGSALRPEYVPMQFCQVLVGQKYGATLTSSQVSNMIIEARKEPNESKKAIIEKANKLLDFDHPILKIDSKDLLSVTATQLPIPVVSYKSGGIIATSDGGWNMRFVNGYTTGKTLPEWGVLIITQPDGRYATNKVNEGTRARNQKMQTRGLMKSSPLVTATVDTAFFGKDDDLKLELQKYDKVKFWFVFVPGGFSSDQYKRLKRVCDVQLGVHTCCVNTDKTLSDPQYWDNQLLKVNLKLGGVNQQVQFPDARIIDFKKTMVIGLDVTHPAPGSDGTEQSIAGMVASVDHKMGQWPATMARQSRPKEEVVFAQAGIEALLHPHLDRWKKNSNASKYPEQIIVYRDGVSEGQYEQVVNNEYQYIRLACARKYGKQTMPRITIVIVGKRHHMRFFLEDEGKTLNPTPGTVIDRGVTSQFLWEFYLQAHKPFKGTARPAHYVVVVDEIFRDMNERTMGAFGYRDGAGVLIEVTHCLSYNLGRSTKATCVCTPAFLADKLCDRTRAYDEPAVNQNLRESMFYI